MADKVTVESVLRQCEIVIYRREDDLQHQIRYYERMDTSIYNKLGMEKYNQKKIDLTREYQEMVGLRRHVKALRKTGQLSPLSPMEIPPNE